MKGSVNILSAGLVILGLEIMVLILNPIQIPHSATYAKTDIYVMKNALDASGVYLETALDYSAYQAMYDVAKRSGLKETSGSQTVANNLAPSLPTTQSCATSDKRIGETDEVIGCVPGKFGCSESEGKEAYINEGYQVGLLQFLLKHLGYSMAVDCQFGKTSLEKMKQFQKSNVLEESGAADSEAVKKLTELFAYDNCGDYFSGCSNRVSVFWDGTLNEDGLKSALEAEITKNLNMYTAKDYMFLDLPLVHLPQYEEKNTIVTEGPKGVKVSVAGGKLSMSKRDDYEIISVKAPSSMDRFYEVDFFGMQRKAQYIYKNIKLKPCSEVSDESIEEDGFKIDIKIQSQKLEPECQKDIRVSITEENPKKFPVFNGREASLEPISFEFLLNVKY